MSETRQSILITGANGFVGNALYQTMQSAHQNYRLTGTSRQLARFSYLTQSPELGPTADWTKLLKEVDTVIHCAALIQTTQESKAAALKQFRTVNLEGTATLAQQAANLGIRRFIHLSTIKVNGETTEPGKPFQHTDPPAPQDAYALSKTEAEQALKSICQNSNMEFVILRAPLVYGPGVKGNFAHMMNAINRRIPLPLGAITHNKRSLIAVGNLVDLIITCINHPSAANQTFLASDGEDLSTTELLQKLATATGTPARLLKIPPSILTAAASVLRRRALAQRLFGNLQLDTHHTQTSLNWTPPLTVAQGLRLAVTHKPC